MLQQMHSIHSACITLPWPHGPPGVYVLWTVWTTDENSYVVTALIKKYFICDSGSLITKRVINLVNMLRNRKEENKISTKLYMSSSVSQARPPFPHCWPATLLQRECVPQLTCSVLWLVEPCLSGWTLLLFMHLISDQNEGGVVFFTEVFHHSKHCCYAGCVALNVLQKTLNVSVLWKKFMILFTRA